MKIMRKKPEKQRFAARADAFHNVQREIAIMKKCQHPNIVRLIEIIDAPENDKVYISTLLGVGRGLRGEGGGDGRRRCSPANAPAHRGSGGAPVLEYLESGSVVWQTPLGPALSEFQARRYFRDVVLGLEYRTCSPCRRRRPPACSGAALGLTGRCPPSPSSAGAHRGAGQCTSKA